MADNVIRIAIDSAPAEAGARRVVRALAEITGEGRKAAGSIGQLESGLRRLQGIARASETSLNEVAAGVAGPVDNAGRAFNRLQRNLLGLESAVAESGITDVFSGMVDDLVVALGDPAVRDGLVARAESLRETFADALEQAAKGGGDEFTKLLANLSGQIETFGPALSLLGPKAAGMVTAVQAGIPVVRGLAELVRDLAAETNSANRAFESFKVQNSAIARLQHDLQEASGKRREVIQRQLDERRIDARAPVMNVIADRLIRLTDKVKNIEHAPPEFSQNKFNIDELLHVVRLLQKVLDETDDTVLEGLVQRRLDLELGRLPSFIRQRIDQFSPSRINGTDRRAAAPSLANSTAAELNNLGLEEGIVLHSRLRPEIDATAQANRLYGETLGGVRDRMAGLAQPFDMTTQHAMAWRDAALAGLDETRAGYDAFAAEIDVIFNDRLAQSMDSALVQIQEVQNQATGLSRELADAAKNGFDTYAAAATNATAQVEGLVAQGLGSMEDALVGFVKTGKLEWRSLVDSMIEDLIRLFVRSQILGPLAQAFGGLFGGGGLGPQFTGTGAAGLASSGSFQHGGILTGPALLAAGGRVGLAGEAGPEAILPLARLPGGDLGVRSGGGGAVVNNIQVINEAGGAVETQERPNASGGLDTVIRVLKRDVERDILEGGRINKAIASGFGLRNTTAVR